MEAASGKMASTLLDIVRDPLGPIRRSVSMAALLQVMVGYDAADSQLLQSIIAHASLC